MVVVGHPVDAAGLTRVDVENRQGSVGAVRHLIQHGRERIAFVGPTVEYLFGVDRLAGYQDALVAAGLADDDGLVQLEQPTVEGGYRATTAVLAARPDAIYVATDTMAQGAYGALAAHGRRIPDDIAIVGFDGLPRGPRLDPPLTTVVQPVADVGRAAVGLLASDDTGPQVVVLPTTLRVGRSCGDDHDPTAG
jgi:DNA-binding LacI/PurR family transcriptional regulator